MIKSNRGSGDDLFLPSHNNLVASSQARKRHALANHSHQQQQDIPQQQHQNHASSASVSAVTASTTTNTGNHSTPQGYIGNMVTTMQLRRRKVMIFVREYYWIFVVLLLFFPIASMLRMLLVQMDIYVVEDKIDDVYSSMSTFNDFISPILSDPFQLIFGEEEESDAAALDRIAAEGNEKKDLIRRDLFDFIPKNRKHLVLSAKRRAALKYIDPKSNTPISLEKQVTTPMVHSKTSQRMFGCLRTECQGLAMEDLSDRRWRLMFKSGKESANKFKDNINLRVTILITDTTELTKLSKLKPDTYTSIVHGQVGKTYLSAIDNADVIGGNKGLQLRTKVNLAKRQGCSYNSLSIQPAQYRLYLKEECDAFLGKLGRPTTFLLKPETGSQGQGITFHKDVKSLQEKAGSAFFPCRTNVSMLATERMLAMEYIARPLLLKRCKFDVRVYMLIAGTDPWLVFYHEGYLRRSLTEYHADSKDRKVYLTNTHFQSMKEGFKLSEHIWSFQTFQDYLTRVGKTGSHYVQSILEPYIKRVANFVFQSAKSKLVRRKGSFQIFGLDFMVDDRYQVHFIEANGFPGYTWSINFDSRGMVTDLFDLVQEVHEAPSIFEHMRPGDRYGGFQMIYSEVQEEREGLSYDSCWEFYKNAESFDILRTANRHFAQYTGHAAGLLHQKDESADQDDPDNTEKCKTKRCQAEKKLAKKAAYKAKLAADRMFNRLSDELFGARAGEKILLGASKATELSILSKFTQNFGCSWNLLGVMPPTYRLDSQKECERLFKYRTASNWIVKPADHAGRRGKGFRFFAHQQEIEHEFSPICNDKEKSKENRLIAQKRIPNLLQIGGVTYDFRAYMLVGSTDPFLVFYHRGFARSARYDLESQEYQFEEKPILSFDDIQALINAHGIAGSHFVETVLEMFMKRVMVLIFRSIFEQLKEQRDQMKKSYQLFELNFVIDENYRPWFIGGVNGAPSFHSRKSSGSGEKDYDVRAEMMENLKSLVLEVNDVPDAFSGMKYGDGYGGFRLLFSEYENVIANVTYDPCNEFSKHFGPPKAQVSYITKVHNAKEREGAANQRELRKYVREKWSNCRSKRSVATCAETTRKYITERYKIFLEKEKIRLGGELEIETKKSSRNEDNDEEGDGKHSNRDENERESEEEEEEGGDKHKEKPIRKESVEEWVNKMIQELSASSVTTSAAEAS